MINEGNWQTIAQGSSPNNVKGWEFTIPILEPCDYAKIRIKLPAFPHWIRMGWFRQITWGIDFDVLTKRQLHQESRLIELVQVDECILVFQSMDYIKNYQYEVKVRFLN
ncbi:hypothetical protein [Gloeothece verrucosa]|uniref:Uncharacterized protein n=1 Tax=Gloeothece verrucosa (strain PCC 7822) TaxID=497965 RepID=E0U6Y4_GLOV7|nr:hypothetical protein [Gloeothece verrucosa]ADN16021.1 hypothetical protein Cyan7822_4101 [Gloeothece verrucosa PCC 7822]ADN16471.1 hypothetical protein Cyan7822_4562 [Gloeothece verrucosa PCC 7822]